MASEYLKWKYRDVQPDAPIRPTRTEQLLNWWHYHKWQVVVGIVLVAILLDIGSSVLGIGKVQPDYQIAYVGTTVLPEDTVSALEQAIGALGEDANGDGQVVVELHQYVMADSTADAENANYTYASQVTLMADLEDFNSYFFILQDYETFQQDYQVLAPTSEADADTEGCALAWESCPVLSGLALGAYRYEVAGQTVTGDSQELLTLLQRRYRLRPTPLKEMDRRRAADPNWYQGNQWLGMCLYVKEFAGNLQGVMEKLDYLQEAGVNYLHLMPLLDTVDGRSDGGYAVADFRKVKPELGTMEDLAALTAACHARGISCCLDFVMNHTSEDHPWAKRARAGDPVYQDYYFFYDRWDIPNEYEKHVPQVFPTTAPGNFTYLEDMNKIVLTSFYPYQWDLNYGNPAVFHAMVDQLLYLANRGVDILRIDAVPYIWKELGTDCRNRPQVHSILRMIRMICEIVCPGVLLLGEVVMAPEKLAPYFGSAEKPECHMLYNATTMCTTWHTVATADTRLLRHQMDSVHALPKNDTFLNYLRCHDDIGWGLDYPYLRQFGMEEVPHKAYLNAFFTGETANSVSCGERYNSDPRLGDARLCGTTASLVGIERAEAAGDEAALERAIQLDLMLHAFLFSQSGIPMLYAGDEVGQLNDNTYHLDPKKAEDSRYLHRGAFQWSLAAQRWNGDCRPEKLFQGLRKLEQLRCSHAVFMTDAEVCTIDCGDDRILGLKRQRHGEQLIALYNFSAASATAAVNAVGTYTDLLTGCAVSLSGAWELPPYGFAWLSR